MGRGLLDVAITRARRALVLVANRARLLGASEGGLAARDAARASLRVPGGSAPITDAVDVVEGSSIADAVPAYGADTALPAPADGDVTLLVGRADTCGIPRALDRVGPTARLRVLYRAEGAIGRQNVEAPRAAVEDTKRDVTAVGVDAVLAGTALSNDTDPAYAAQPRDLRTPCPRVTTTVRPDRPPGVRPSVHRHGPPPTRGRESQRRDERPPSGACRRVTEFLRN